MSSRYRVLTLAVALLLQSLLSRRCMHCPDGVRQGSSTMAAREITSQSDGSHVAAITLLPIAAL